jgi:cytosine/creatinine deaminase
MNSNLDPETLLIPAIEEVRLGLAEGGIPIGAAIFSEQGELISRGHNRRVQHNDPSSHGETDAFRNAGRHETWRDKIFVTSLAPCWYCSGLVHVFGFPTLIIGDDQRQPKSASVAFLEGEGVEVIQLHSDELYEIYQKWTGENPETWAEDSGFK